MTGECSRPPHIVPWLQQVWRCWGPFLKGLVIWTAGYLSDWRLSGSSVCLPLLLHWCVLPVLAVAEGKSQTFLQIL
ncbi:guanine nucleotide-binding protein G(I)/G(S)/G(O) subunit gamma-7 isoform X2 [Rana temporaria]|uniref:guanine nucleotide-binding protein G(I)/G(S)/G(O) subunit gamma-7 isoform X2 n=1 Tax=Rana temporaria TaxID=8407 RepID=UPI001AACCF53|nr:guanine nucleotide-binding protein G(I)/G(S)/G(O) subunit gamma-7 isoform X2 [Rana temporaria]